VTFGVCSCGRTAKVTCPECSKRVCEFCFGVRACRRCSGFRDADRPGELRTKNLYFRRLRNRYELWKVSDTSYEGTPPRAVEIEEWVELARMIIKEHGKGADDED